MRVVLPLFFLCLTGVCLIVACAGRAPVMTDENKTDFDQPIIRGDGLLITGSHIFDRLQFSEFQKSGGILPESELRRFIDTLLIDTLTGLEARHVDLRQHYLDYWSYRFRFLDFAVKAYFDEVVRFNITADSSEIIDFYESNLDVFTYEEQVELWHILVAPIVLLTGPDSSVFNTLDSAALDSAVRSIAFSLYDSITAGAQFADIAIRHSHDQISVLAGGYVGWTPRNRYIDPFDSVAFALEPGGVAQPYRDRDGWHIVMITDHVEDGPAPLTNQRVYNGARDMVIAQKVERRSQAVLDSLMDGVQFTFREDLLDSNSSLIDDTVWAAVVNDRDTIDYRFLKNYETEYIMRFGSATMNKAVRQHLLFQIGRRFTVLHALESAGLDQREYIQNERRRLRANAAKSVLEAQRFDPSWRPDDSTVRAHYEANLHEYHTDKPLTISVITANDSLLAAYLTDLANSGYDLTDLVKNYVPREQGMKARLQESIEVGPDDVPRALWSSAFATRVGQSSRVARIDDTTYAFARVLKRRESQSYDQVRGSIVSHLTNQYRRQQVNTILDRLKEKYNIDIAESLPTIRLRPYVERTMQPAG